MILLDNCPRNNNEEIEIHSTYYPMVMIGKIFESDIDRIERKRFNDYFIYTCYDIKGIKKFIFSIDWEDNILEFQTSSELKKHIFDVAEYRSNDLFDKANTGGMIESDTSRIIID